MNDYIRLPRSALNEAIWRDANLARLCFYLLSKADENGDIQTDMATIAKDLVLSRQQVRTLMLKVESNQILTKSATTRTTKLKLNIQEDKPKRQPRKQPNQQPNTNQIKSTIFTPPTDEEVAAYVAEKGYHFNPEEFVPFYQMRGWKMKGGEPMKDWKAGCRYWETNWKQKHGERFYYEIQPANASVLRSGGDQFTELESFAVEVLRKS